MVESESTPEGEPTAQTTQAEAFANLRGFQRLPTAAGESQPDEASLGALGAELDRRAARIRDAVDSAFILANDGAIRWLGDPVAKLAKGDDLFSPQAILLADEAMSAESREAALSRIGLWLTATVSRLLGPLRQLETSEEGSEPTRLLSRDVARALGVLDRESVRARVKALDQDARATLRKLGVRFGAYYIYVPALLKPAPRALALHLWSLQAESGRSDGLVEALAPLASSGRTSIAAEPSISREAYRVAGFRLSENRAVRVDIVERLGDIIRSAMTAPASRRAPPGFLVTGQLTSLAGCSGEQFAAILRAMGFASVEMKRSDYLAAITPEAVAPTAPAADASSLEGAAAQDGAADAAPPAPAEEESAPNVSESEPEAQLLALEAHAEPASAQTATETHPDEHAVVDPAEASGAPQAPAADPDETVMVWRHAPRSRVEHSRNGPRRGARPDSANGRDADPGRRRRPFGKRPEGVETVPVQGEPPKPPPVEAGPRVATEERHSSRDQRRPKRFEGNPRDARAKNAPQGSGGFRTVAPAPQAKAADPNSPFAKLAELKSALEARDKKRP